jgi:hypothetical protein
MDFWTDNTRVSPNMKDEVKKHVAVKEWTTHPSHHFMESEVFKAAFYSCIVLV